jgi:hypothetical protein
MNYISCKNLPIRMKLGNNDLVPDIFITNKIVAVPPTMLPATFVCRPAYSEAGLKLSRILQPNYLHIHKGIYSSIFVFIGKFLRDL